MAEASSSREGLSGHRELPKERFRGRSTDARVNFVDFRGIRRVDDRYNPLSPAPLPNGIEIRAGTVNRKNRTPAPTNGRAYGRLLREVQRQHAQL